MKDSSEALKALVLRATRAPANVSRLEGEGGLTASIEHSDQGPAREIRVEEGGVERYRSVLVQPGEPRPDFYPDDIPFTARASCSATWSADFGLAVLWSLPVDESAVPGREALADLPPPSDSESVEEFMRRFLAAGKEEKLRMVGELSELAGESFVRRIEETFGDITEAELPAESQALSAELITFHVQGGWEVHHDPDHSGPGHGWILTTGDRQRRLSARTMLGMSTVTLSERSRGRSPGSSQRPDPATASQP